MMFGKNKGVTAILQHIPKDSVGVEIGVWRGDSSEKFLSRAKHLHLVDPWSVRAYVDSDDFGGFDMYLNRYSELTGAATIESFKTYYDGVYESVKSRFSGKPVTIHRCTSSEFFGTFNGHVDWVYIDGDHSEGGCHFDLMGAARISSGYIFGDDYGSKDGVTAAVDRFINETGLPINVYGTQYKIG